MYVFKLCMCIYIFVILLHTFLFILFEYYMFWSTPTEIHSVKIKEMEGVVLDATVYIYMIDWTHENGCH
jgi:hypothetical protein